MGAVMIALLLLATAGAHARYDEAGAPRAAEMVAQAIRFATVAGNDGAQAAQKDWLLRTAVALGLTARDAGAVTEIDLPGPPGAPVLGLMVHGDVQPVDEKAWTIPPFAGLVRDGRVWGRGAADDKGPLVQALLALAALKEAGPPRTHTVRLLVGTDEESGSTDLPFYVDALKARLGTPSHIPTRSSAGTRKITEYPEALQSCFNIFLPAFPPAPFFRSDRTPRPFVLLPFDLASRASR